MRVLIAILMLILISPLVIAQQQVTIMVRGNMVNGHVVNQALSYAMAEGEGLNFDTLLPQEAESYSISLQRYAKTRIVVRHLNGKGCQFIFSEVLPDAESGINPGFAPNQGFVTYPRGFVPYPGYVPYQGMYRGSYGNTVGTAILTAMPLTSDSICSVDENATLTAR